MDIIAVDRSDDALVEQLWGVIDRSEAASRVLPHRVTVDEFAQGLRYAFPGEHDEAAAAVVDGRAVGWARVWFPERDNLDKCWPELHVDPDRRRSGIGSALLGWVEDTARAQQRSMVLPEVHVPVDAGPEHAGRRFAQKHGYAVSSTEIMRRLRLPLDESRVGPLEAKAREAVGERYQLSVHLGGVPDQLRPSLCEVSNRLPLDAPTGDVDFEADSMTPADYQNLLEHEASIGRLRLTAVAVDTTTGDVVAYSDLALPKGDPEVAFQWGTLVSPEHRGHRLGMAVKVANLRELARTDPARREVRTSNAEDNPWMVQINIDLGFGIVEEALMLRKDL